MKIISRIERLEDELLPLPTGPAINLHIQGIDEEGKVVSTTVFKVPQYPLTRVGRRHRRFASRRDW